MTRRTFTFIRPPRRNKRPSPLRSKQAKGRPRPAKSTGLAALTRPAATARWLAVGLVLLSTWLVTHYSTLREYYTARLQRNQNMREVVELRETRERLLAEKRELDQLGFSAEKTIRERYKMARPGERVLQIVTPTPSGRGERSVSRGVEPDAVESP